MRETQRLVRGEVLMGCCVLASILGCKNKTYVGRSLPVSWG